MVIELNCNVEFTLFKDQDKLFCSLKSNLKNNVCNGKDLSLHFVPNGQPIPKATDTLLPVITGDKNFLTLSFNWKKYQEHLKTKVLGQVMFYTDVITSTQTVFDGWVWTFKVDVSLFGMVAIMLGLWSRIVKIMSVTWCGPAVSACKIPSYCIPLAIVVVDCWQFLSPCLQCIFSKTELFFSCCY